MKQIRKSEASKDNFMYKLAALGLLIVLFWLFFVKGDKVPFQQAPKITQITAQLMPANNGKEWGTASKTSDGVNFTLNVTAFLPKTSGGTEYYVYLKGDGAQLKDMLLGKMILSGDVYSLNYQSDMDYFGYTNLVVVKQTESASKEGKMSPVVLTATFPK